MRSISSLWQKPINMSEDILGIASVDFFFSKEVSCHFVDVEGQKALSKKHLLPPLSEVYGEECFAAVLMGWNPLGLAFCFEVEQENSLAVDGQDIRRGDSIELFIDTRRVAS